MSSIGRRLRERREALGLSVDDLASRTRIGRDHLVAIEEDRLEDLPPGPYEKAWVRAVHEALELDPPDYAPPDLPPPRVPLAVVRGIGLAAAFTAIGLVAWSQWGHRLVDAPPPGGRVPDLHVGLVARRTVVVEVQVDGEPLFAGELAGGEERTFEAHDRVVIQVPSVDAVRVTRDGQQVVPQGRQDTPRRLVFVDDEGS